MVRDAGLFWYHPHVMSAAQVGFGLYGALQVDDPDDGVGVKDELTLVLSDIGFDKFGSLEPADSGGPAGEVFGREGQYVLVNGRRKPTIRMRAGAPQRWRIVNAAKSRFFLLDMDGQPFTTIGVDGGLQEEPVTSGTLLITTGERVDVIIAPTGKPGSTLVIRAMLYNRGYGSVQYRDVEELLTIQFTDEPPLPVKKPPVIVRGPSCRQLHRGDARAGRADAAAGRQGWQVGVPRQRRALLGGGAVYRGARRDPDLGRSRTTPTGITPSTCTATSSWRSTRRISRCGRWRGRTRSTSR